jgi:hypothetical protein
LRVEDRLICLASCAALESSKSEEAYSTTGCSRVSTRFRMRSTRKVSQGEEVLVVSKEPALPGTMHRRGSIVADLE